MYLHLHVSCVYRYTISFLLSVRLQELVRRGKQHERIWMIPIQCSDIQQNIRFIESFTRLLSDRFNCHNHIFINLPRYIWRICIAIHVGPRFLISLVYHRFYLSLLSDIAPRDKKTFSYHIWTAFAFNLVEQAALIGVTYISNRENYRKISTSLVYIYDDAFVVYLFFYSFLSAVHEKSFITFMVSSQIHMLVVLRLLKMAQFDKKQDVNNHQRSYIFKRRCFIFSLLCTFGLCVFFIKHRAYCHDMGNMDLDLVKLFK